MDKDVPPRAAILLDFIGDIEAPKGDGTIYSAIAGGHCTIVSSGGT